MCYLRNYCQKNVMDAFLWEFLLLQILYLSFDSFALNFCEWYKIWVQFHFFVMLLYSFLNISYSTNFPFPLCIFSALVQD